jgi:NAD(P)-dependent dehydrogenase (short-subunit alcohol dehydrogenase family)
VRGLRDKVAIVAGAAPGNIGGATALRLAQEGMKVTAGDFNEAAARAVVDQIKSAGGHAVARAFDITKEASYEQLIDFTVKEFGGLDGLFNVAADLSVNNIGRDTDVTSVPLDVWQHTIDVTLTGYMYGVRHALPLLIKRGGGVIVNTTSSEVWMGEDVRVAYQTAKSGLIGLTRHTATLGGKHGVRCNLLAPGFTLTKAAYDNTTEEYRKQMLASVRSPRLGAPEDIAAMVAFLFSDDGAYINGQNMLVDGGANLT